jgi:transcriptional regulator with GAF, ATPase, and Fis domain
LETLYQEAPIGLCVLDRELRFVRINERLATIHEKPAAEHIGRGVHDILPKKLAEYFVPLLEDIVRTGTPFFDHEATGEVPADSTVRKHWRASAYPLFDAGSKVSGVSVVVQDVTELRRHERQLSERVKFEKLLADISAAFVNVPVDELDTRINDALERIGRFTDVDRGFVDQFSEDQECCRVTHSWSAPGIGRDPMLDPEDGTPLEELQLWYTERMREGRGLIFSSIDEIPAEAPEAIRYMQAAGIKSSAIVPMNMAGSVIGSFGLDAMRVHREWSDELVQRLQLVADIFAAALMRQRQQRVIAEQLDFEKLIADISSKFVHLAPDAIGKQIEVTLGKLGTFLKVDLATVLQCSAESGNWRHTHEWIAPDSPAGAPSFRNVVVDDSSYSWVKKQLTKMHPIAITRPDEFPDEAEAERRTCAESGLKSVLWVPFEVQGSVAGFIAFNSLKEERRWSETMVRRIGIIGEIFGNALARAAAVAELERLNARLAADNVYLREEVTRAADFQDIVGRSEAFTRVLYQVDQVAPTDTTVLLLGETGTGKELIARALHARGSRSDRPLVTVNCAALPSSLIESELFGHEKGAFTGATGKRVGRFTLADGTTIFLDEVGDLPLELQAKLLRVLQDGEFEPLGSSKTIKVDARVIAATNRDLRMAMEEGTFRADLFYRLNVFPIALPPLRARRKDIPLLVWYFIDKLKSRLGKTIDEVPTEVMDQLCSYDWPGNVRELENVIERAMILSPSTGLRLHWEEGPIAKTAAARGGETLEHVEREHILRVLDACDWKIKGKGNAAERLGLHPNTLRFRMSKLGIKRPRREEAEAVE